MSEDNKKEPVKVSVSFKSVDDKPKFKFTPEVSVENFNYHFSNIVNNFVASYFHLMKDFTVLRPATDEEHELHAYIFKTDDTTDTEHSIYNARKNLYNITKQAFDTVLQHVYPDIEYINSCSVYQQEYAFDHSKEESEDYLNSIKELTNNVRENYDDLLAMFLASTDPELFEQMNKAKEENFETTMEA